MAKAASDIEKKKCVTPSFRVSFPALFKPKAFENQEPKYSVTMLFPKSTDLKPLKTAVLNAAIEKWGPKEKWPKGLRMPFRDGDEKSDTTGYAGHIFVAASSKTPVGIVNQSLRPILNEGDLYAGCHARAELLAFAYDKAGNRGVSFALQNVQKLKDDKPFSGRKDAASVFDAVEDTSEDESSYEDVAEAEDDDGLGF